MDILISVYQRVDADRPGPSFAAYISQGAGFLPIRFDGATYDEAGEKAERWWNAEVEREHGSHEARERRLSAMAEARAKAKAKREAEAA